MEEPPKSPSVWFLLLLAAAVVISSCLSVAGAIHSSDMVVISNSTTDELANYTAISDFRVINRRILIDCPTLNPFVEVTVSPDSGLPNDGFVKVDVKGILLPTPDDWLAMVSPSHADGSSCPLMGFMYAQTGDISRLPLLCHYPIKAQFLSSDPDYLGCKKKECTTAYQKDINNTNVGCIKTCGATLSFHVVNIRTDIQFILFSGGFETPCVRSRASSVGFANPKMPLHGHLSSVDSAATSVS
uniref:Purple acid phosphatase Fn3-like domain-containing protein n=1 Tax=Kalanchoe fedtschenkoi TaxID=63787 RepID=A0A7N0VLU7_KALFE